MTDVYQVCFPVIFPNCPGGFYTADGLVIPGVFSYIVDGAIFHVSQLFEVANARGAMYVLCMHCYLFLHLYWRIRPFHVIKTDHLTKS